MKKLAMFSMLVLALVTFAVSPAVASDPAGSMFEVAQLEPLALMGLETPEWMVPETDISLNCSHFNNSYCTYRLNKSTFCCVPIYVAPGANCPMICI